MSLTVKYTVCKVRFRKYFPHLFSLFWSCCCQSLTKVMKQAFFFFYVTLTTTGRPFPTDSDLALSQNLTVKRDFKGAVWNTFYNFCGRDYDSHSNLTFHTAPLTFFFFYLKRWSHLFFFDTIHYVAIPFIIIFLSSRQSSSLPSSAELPVPVLDTSSVSVSLQ